MAITTDEYKHILAQRWAQEDRLKEAGIVMDGGGVDLITGKWDIFVYEGPEADMYDAILSSVEDVDAYIKAHGRTVSA